MHSKVIIASLVCMLAASFGGSRVANVAETPKLKAEETSCCNAPNEESVRIGFNQDKIISVNNEPFVLTFNIYGSYPICQDFEVMEDPRGLFDQFFFFPNGQLGAYVNFPSGYPGESYVSFGAYGKEMCRMYIHTNGSYSCASGVSYNDAKAKFFFWQQATSTEMNYYPNGGGQQITSNTGFNAVKRFGTYTYGTNDIVTTRSTTSGGFNSSLTVKLHLDWYNNNTAYRAEGIKLNLYLDGVQIRPLTIKRTNVNGDYTITLNNQDNYIFKQLGSLQFAIHADGAATTVEDNYGFDYPYLYSSSSSTYLYKLKTVTYNVKIYPERSDRAAAYEITQAQKMIRGYINSFNSPALASVKTYYPSYRTAYRSLEEYYEPSIQVRKDHYDSWDVLNHEYAHYACESLGLCDVVCDEEHKYNEDLSITHGSSLGARMAYSEGLATFITIAGQIKCAIYSSGAYVNQIAGFEYNDSLNGVCVDYYESKYGEPYSPHSVYVEGSVTSVMVKLLFGVNMGDTLVWNAIKNVGGDNTTFVGFLDELVRNNPNYDSAIRQLLQEEGILDQYESLSTIAPTAEWTIMMYMCATNLPYDTSFTRILDVSGQPQNVNIIVEIGGYQNSNRIDRYHVRNQQLILDEYFYAQYSDEHMGDESTFEDFLFWGLENYPARKTGIILWNHGQAINGICHDPRDPVGTDVFDSLTVSETTTAFTNAFNYFGIDKLEFIGYDACLMQVQDVADYNSDFFKYMVASEEEQVDFMWRYDGWLGNLYDGDDTETILKAIVDSFVFSEVQYQYTWEQTLSVLDLSKMATYRQKFENLIQEAMDFIFNSGNQAWEYYTRFLYLASNNSHQYGNQLSSEWLNYGTNDIYHFLTILMNDEVFGSVLGYTASDVRYFLYPTKVMYVDETGATLENELATFGPNARRTLVIYKRSNYVRGGQWACQSHGLAMHVWTEENQIYPYTETRFVKWRQMFFDYRYEYYGEAYTI